MRAPVLRCSDRSKVTLVIKIELWGSYWIFGGRGSLWSIAIKSSFRAVLEFLVFTAERDLMS